MLAVLVTVAQFIFSVSGSEIVGPLPTNELAPIGSTVVFMCNASISTSTQGMVWRVTGVMKLDNEMKVGQTLVSTLPVLVKAGYYNATIECGTQFFNLTTKYSRTSAKLTGYGKY